MIGAAPARQALRHRNFRPVLAAEALSKLGSEFSLIAVAFAVLTVTGSAGELGLVLMARTLPPLALLVVGGVWADRLGNARLMIAADLTAFAAQLGLGIVLVTGHYNLPLVMALQAILGSASAMFRPAIAGLIPQTVPDDDLQSANSLVSIVGNSASLLGPVLAGALLTLTEPGLLVLIDAATFACSALLLSRLWSLGMPEGGGPSRRRFLSEASEGFAYVARTSWLAATVPQALLFQMGFAVFFTLGPVVALEGGGGASAWGVTVAAFGGGSLLGGLIALRYRPRTPVLAMQLVLVLTLPILLVMAVGGPLVIQLATAALAGAAFALSQTLWETFIQLTTPRDRLGRVVSVATLGAASLRPFGYLLAGWFAVVAGTPGTFAGTALILMSSIVVVTAVLLPARERLSSSATSERSEAAA